MQMRMVDAKKMCTKCLKLEHTAIHQAVRLLRSGHDILGQGTIFPQDVVGRHEQLVEEMERRGIAHGSFISMDDEKMLEALPEVSYSPGALKAQLSKDCAVCAVMLLTKEPPVATTKKKVKKKVEEEFPTGSKAELIASVQEEVQDNGFEDKEK